MGRIDIAVKEMVRDSVIEEMGDMFCADDYYDVAEVENYVDKMMGIVNAKIVEIENCMNEKLFNVSTKIVNTDEIQDMIHEYNSTKIWALAKRLDALEHPPSLWVRVKSLARYLFIAKSVPKA